MAKILVVDDELTIRSLICMALDPPHTVIEASDGQEGLYHFNKHLPDIVITDMNMPNMTGIEFVKRLRILSTTVKIIVHSASVGQQKKCEEALAAGADICIPKAVDIVILEKAIADLLPNN
ncbi:MAG: response regulator [Acidobacteriota bacterium]